MKDVWVKQQLLRRLGQHLKARAKLDLEGAEIVSAGSKLPQYGTSRGIGHSEELGYLLDGVPRPSEVFGRAKVHRNQ